MKQCTNCKAKLRDQAVVCVKCGYLQERVSLQTVPAKQAAEKAPGKLAVAPAVSAVPVGQLKTNRGLLKFILLSFLTFGIYGIVVMSCVSTDINIIAGRYDGRKTMHYCLVYFLFSWLTLGIVPLVWSHKLSGRIGRELNRRKINYKFGSGSFWGWAVLGSLILVGPLVYLHKLLKAMNLLSLHYNLRG